MKLAYTERVEKRSAQTISSDFNAIGLKFSDGQKMIRLMSTKISRAVAV